MSWSELACKDRLKTPYPLDWRDTRAVVLAGAFEALRARIGGVPLVVLSAYRTPAHNRAVGGVPESQHVQGRALDLRPPKGWTPIELAAVAQDIPAIRGLGIYDTFLHLDVREAEHLVVWNDRKGTADTV